MAGKKKTETKRPIESYEHRDKGRLNNPPAGLVTPKTDPDAGEKKKRYAYNPHLDPQLVWADKAEHTSFEAPTVSLHVHERIVTRAPLSRRCARRTAMGSRRNCPSLSLRAQRLCARPSSSTSTGTAGRTASSPAIRS